MTVRDRAREHYARAVAAEGPTWQNAANSIRAGFENVWIAPAIAAIEAVLRLVPDEADHEGSGT